MHSKLLTLAALASAASAQMMNLTTAIGSNQNLSALAAALGPYPQLLGQIESMKNITLLAPSNEAFAKVNLSAIAANDTSLIDAFFSYHILNGTYDTGNFTSTPMFIPTALQDPNYSNVTGGQVVEAITAGGKTTFYSGLLQNSSVIQPNISFTGGVIQVVDSFLTIPLNISATLVELNLTSAVGALGEVNSAQPGPLPNDITAFIPNNAAFQAIGSMLSNISINNLSAILNYHIVIGSIDYSTMLSKNTTLVSATKENLTITVEGDSVFVNSAKIVLPNVLVAEGVVHVIDEVLNPANASATPKAGASSGVPAFVGASSMSNVPFTSGVPTPSVAIPTATPAASTGAGASGSGAGAGAGAGASSSTKGAAMPMKTGAMGAAALFGGAAVIINM